MSAAMGELHGQVDGSIVPPRPMSQTFVPCINVTGPVSLSLASVVPPVPLTLALIPPPQSDYFSQEAVRTALHVSPKALAWSVCSSVVK